MFKQLRSLFVPLFLLTTLTAAPALAAYNAWEVPPGWSGEAPAWTKLYQRADKFARIASKLAKGSSVDCLRAVLLKVLIATEIGTSLDSSDHGLARNVSKSSAPKLRKYAEQERDNSCNGPSGGNAGANVEAMAKLPEEVPEWETAPLRAELVYLYDLAKPKATPSTPWVVELLKAGILVPVAEGASRAAAGLMMPILDPSRFGKPKYDPQDGI